jgi:hypothetical protein
MTTEHEEVRSAHERLDALVGNSSEQMNPLAQPPVSAYALFDFGEQRRCAEAAPQLQLRQRAHGFTDTRQHGERVFVAIEMAHPQDAGVPAQTGCQPRLRLIPGPETARALGDLINLRRRPYQIRANERLRLIEGAE